MFGTVKKYFLDRGYGFIIDEHGIDRYFHISKVQESSQENLGVGQIVKFNPSSNPEGPIAIDIRIKSHNSEMHLTRERADFLYEISQWKMEAKLQDTSRYFYYFDGVKQLEQGDKCCVIGRKGTGKTAVCEYLNSIFDPNVFSKKLTFKNFPFNTLYKHENGQYTTPNQYITIWKFIILSEIAKLMMLNQNIDISVRNKLASIYSNDIDKKLGINIQHWTSGEFEINILGTGVAVGAAREFVHEPTSWIEKVQVLEEYIKQNIDNSRYIITFDELDEDYKYIGEQVIDTRYGSLMVSLFKAVQDLKAIFNFSQYNILPIIFLRDDIFSQLFDSDRTKWNDLTIKLDWNYEQQRNHIAFRLSRSWKNYEEEKPFEHAWLELFSPEPIKRHGKKISLFKLISDCTLERPRDYISFIKVCAELALAKRTPVVTSNIVKMAEMDYSAYLRSELEDEIRGVMPEIGKILDVLSIMGKTTFTYNQFNHHYLKYAEEMGLEIRKTNIVLNILFNFSIIGKFSPNNKPIFRYQNKFAKFDPASAYYVLRGLTKSLQLF